MDQYICKNCENEYSGHFCNNCGQKPAHRLDIKHISHEIAHVFTHADRGIFAFIPAILFRPGYVALDYVEGKRKKYFNVFQYLLIIVGLVVFVVSKTHFIENTFKSFTGGAAAEASQRIRMVQEQVIHLMSKYFNVVILASIPIYALVTRMLFRKKGYNYAETVVLYCCIQAQQNTISLVTILLVYFAGTGGAFYIMTLPLLLALICTSIAFRQFYKVSLLQAALKTILSFVIVYGVQMIVTIAVMFIVYKLGIVSVPK